MDAGYTGYQGYNINPNDYLVDRGQDTWQGLDQGLFSPEQVEQSPVRAEGIPQPAGRSLPRLPSVNFGGIGDAWRQHYPKLFWFVVVPATGFSMVGFLLSGGNVTETAINTALSRQSQDSVFQAAIGIVLDQPIPIADGTARAATASEVLDAGRRVMGDQESELLQRKVNEWSIAMTLGQATPGHPCYQLSMEQCIAIQQRDLDTRWQLANQVGNTDELLIVSKLGQALDRIREGNTVPHQWQPDLYQFARAKYVSATQLVKAQTPNGVARTLLKMQQQSAQQAGMMFNPQTGALEPAKP